MSDRHRKPAAFVIDKPGADTEKRKPHIEFAGDEAGNVPVLLPPPPPLRRGLRWGSILLASVVGLLAVWTGLSIAGLIEESFARSPTLGWLALGLAGLAVFATLAMVVREVVGLLRLSRIEHIQRDAAQALSFDDAAAAKRAITALTAIHRHRVDSLWGLGIIRQHEADVIDARERVRLVERYLLAPRDEDAHRIIARTARRVTLITTVTPAASLDMLFVAIQNLRMLRELATLYGGRPSGLATLRLARMVLGHLAVTGGLALGDNLLQHVVGKGLLGRLSARFGEGAVNGIMTARIGIAARDVCRPVPQEPAARETLSSLMRELISFEDASSAN